MLNLWRFWSLATKKNMFLYQNDEYLSAVSSKILQILPNLHFMNFQPKIEQDKIFFVKLKLRHKWHKQCERICISSSLLWICKMILWTTLPWQWGFQICFSETRDRLVFPKKLQSQLMLSRRRHVINLVSSYAIAQYFVKVCLHGPGFQPWCYL